MLSGLVVLLLALWMIRLDFLFWFTALAGLVPLAIAFFETAVRHVTRSVDGAIRPMPDNLVIAAVRRGMRAGVLLAALWALEQSLPSAFTAENARHGKVVSGLFSGTAILIVFDFLALSNRV